MPSTRKRCEHVGKHGWCEDFGREEFCGYCANCWLRLSDTNRERLSALYVPDPPPPAPIVVEQKVQPVIERVRTVYPARTRLSALTLVLWRLLVAGLLGWLTWRAMGGVL